MRVAVTVEQFWHVVPGGIATSTAELLRALAEREDVDAVGVAARHRAPPADAFAVPVPIRHLPLPRRLLYETWQWLRRPLVERATGPVDVVHDAGYGIEAMYARHGLAPMISPLVHRDPVPVSRQGVQVGRATSVVWGPTIKKMIGFGSVRKELSRPSTTMSVEWTVEGERGAVAATVVPLPFLDLERKRT